MKVYRKYMIADYNIIGIRAKFLISFSTTKTIDDMVYLLGAKIEDRKGKEESEFTFYGSPEVAPYGYVNRWKYSTIDQDIGYGKDYFKKSYLGRYEIYDDTPKLIFEVGD